MLSFHELKKGKTEKYGTQRDVATCTPLRTGVHIIILRVSALDNLTSGNRSECTILQVEMQNILGRGMPSDPLARTSLSGVVANHRQPTIYLENILSLINKT